MIAATDVCTLCGAGGEQQNPLVPDEYYADVRLHLHCLNSAEGRAWIGARSEADAGYARYWRLITVGQPVACASCGADERISPKGYGMGAGHWELNCTSCHRYRPLLSAYRSPEQRALLRRLQVLAQRFKLARDVPEVLRELEVLATQETAAGLAEECECGGTHSVAARPRCGTCAGVLIDSPFHVGTGGVSATSAA